MSRETETNSKFWAATLRGPTHSPTPTHTISPNEVMTKFGLAKCGRDRQTALTIKSTSSNKDNAILKTALGIPLRLNIANSPCPTPHPLQQHLALVRQGPLVSPSGKLRSATSSTQHLSSTGSGGFQWRRGTATGVAGRTPSALHDGNGCGGHHGDWAELPFKGGPHENLETHCPLMNLNCSADGQILGATSLPTFRRTKTLVSREISTSPLAKIDGVCLTPGATNHWRKNIVVRDRSKSTRAPDWSEHRHWNPQSPRRVLFGGLGWTLPPLALLEIQNNSSHLVPHHGWQRRRGDLQPSSISRMTLRSTVPSTLIWSTHPWERPTTLLRAVP